MLKIGTMTSAIISHYDCAKLSGKDRQQRGSLKQDSKRYIVAELCRRPIGPESRIHRKLGPWQWQGESALSVAIVY